MGRIMAMSLTILSGAMLLGLPGCVSHNEEKASTTEKEKKKASAVPGTKRETLTSCWTFVEEQNVIPILDGPANEPRKDVKHSWCIPDVTNENVARLAAEYVKPIMSLGDEDIRKLIPPRKPIISWARFADGKEISWTSEYPECILINKEKFVLEKAFPATASEKIVGPDGKEWIYDYSEDENGQKLYITSMRDKAARDWFVEAALKLALLYAKTRDFTYAHKAAIIIVRLAEIYPSYPIYGRESWRGAYKFFSKEPFPYETGKWKEGGHYQNEMTDIAKLARAYDLIYPSGVIAKLSGEMNADLRRVIEVNFFLDACRLMIKYDLWHLKPHEINNMQPYKIRDMIIIGRTIGYPELVHYSYALMDDLINYSFMVDGVFPESPGYHNQMAGNLAAGLREMQGYSDTPGFTSKTGQRFEKIDTSNLFPQLTRALDVIDQWRYPDGAIMPVHDSWPKWRYSSPERHRRQATGSRLFPAFGHAILGTGENDAQMEAHLHFSKSFGHGHSDSLNLILWANGEELLPDIGYTYTYRGWSENSLAHNLVVINGASQKSPRVGPSNYNVRSERAFGGRIASWWPVEKGFGVVQAEDIESYPMCKRYRRTLMLVEADNQHAFLVDIFEVSGGDQHDWMVHGSADRLQKLTFDKPVNYFADSLSPDGKIHIPLSTKEQTAKGLSTEFEHSLEYSQYWGNIRHVNTVSGLGPWQADFSDLNTKDIQLRLHLLSPVDATIFAGEVPSIRLARENIKDIEKYMTPIITARRKNNITSRYVAVWEPCRQKTWLENVHIEAESTNALAVCAEYNGVKFTVLWGAEEDSVIEGGKLGFTGKFGLVISNGKKNTISLLESKKLLISGYNYCETNASSQSEIIDAGIDKNGEYLVMSDTHQNNTNKSRWGILLHPGGMTRAIRLADVVVSSNKTVKVYCPDSLGLHLDKNSQTWTETYLPRRRFEGKLFLKLPIRTDMFSDILTLP